LAQTLGQVCAASGPGGGQAVGIELLITHGEDTWSPVGWHLDGRAKGFYVGVYRATLDADSAHVDCPDQFACACSETAEPTAKAIGDLICDAPPNAAIHPAGWHE
jgi:hypothetical protein